MCSHGCSRSRASYGSPLQDEQTESGSPPHLAPLLKPSQQPQQQRQAGRGMRRAAGQPKLPFKQVCNACRLGTNIYACSSTHASTPFATYHVHDEWH